MLFWAAIGTLAPSRRKVVGLAGCLSLLPPLSRQPFAHSAGSVWRVMGWVAKQAVPEWAYSNHCGQNKTSTLK